jgi:Tfp pilus assembly protein PilO
MDTTEKTRSKPTLAERLQDTGRLRVLVTATMVLVGYAGVYLPLSARIDAASRRLAREQKRRDLARDIEQLRAQVSAFKHRVPEKTDTNEWVQYVLVGVRGFPVKLVALDPGEPQRLGPYKAIVLRIELEGVYHDVDAFLNWLETNDRLFRVDAVKIAPARTGSEMLNMQLTVLGVMG